MKTTCGLLPLLLLTTAVYSGDGDWPTFRGASYDGAAKHKGLFDNGHGLEVAWLKKIGSGYSAISVAGKVAVAMFSDGTDDVVAAFNSDNGQELWRYRIAETHKGRGGAHDGTIATPAVSDGMVYGIGPIGHIFALDLKTGKALWTKHMEDDFKSPKPSFGYSTSPLVAENVLVLQTGAENAAVTGLDKKTGDLLWQGGNDQITYQSPIYTTLYGRKQLVGGGKDKIFGMDATNGKVLWEFAHGGDNPVWNPVQIGEDQLFLRHSFEGGKLLQLSADGDEVVVTQKWESRELRNSENITVHHDGYLYGNSGRFLTCISVEDGSRVWKTREAADGFLILVEDVLAVITKTGELHLAKASPDGYEELASMKVFEGPGWNMPTFAHGKLFLRNLSEMAVIDVGRASQTAIAENKNSGKLPNSAFGKWIAKLEQASDKKAEIDAFMAKQKRFPIIEGKDRVHVVYRGEATDGAIWSDLMHRDEDRQLNFVAGTDFAYYSFKTDPDIVLSYQLSTNFSDPAHDPLNPNHISNWRGDTYSVITMPEFVDSQHLVETEARGKVEEVFWDSALTETKRKVWVYTPPGYENGKDRYPVVYFHQGHLAYEQGLVTRSLDNQIGKTIAPLIAVFIDQHPERTFRELRGQAGVKYRKMAATELPDLIDARFRTQANAAGRAAVGYSSAGYYALQIAAETPGVFGSIAAVSTHFDHRRQAAFAGMLEDFTIKPNRIIVEWGRHDARDVVQHADTAAFGKTLQKVLKDNGFTVEGGETPNGKEWGSWRTRNDDLLAALFPMGKM